MITGNKLKYIIPINPKSGLIMISYLDGKNADIMSGFNHQQLITIIMNTLKKQFPKLKIPKPTWINGKYWPIGVHYFKSFCRVDKDIKKINQPSKKPLWIIGESYSHNQGWIEGSLESAEMALDKIYRLSGL
jgi:monoamine oxidase